MTLCVALCTAPETSVDADAASETGSMAATEAAAAPKKPRKPKAAASDTDAGDQGGEA